MAPFFGASCVINKSPADFGSLICMYVLLALQDAEDLTDTRATQAVMRSEYSNDDQVMSHMSGTHVYDSRPFGQL